MKLRAPKGEGALTLDELDGHVGGLVALGRPRRAQRRALRRRRPARSARRHVRPRQRLRRAAAAPAARRGSRQPGAASISRRRFTCRSSPPTACASPSRPSGRCSTCSPASATRPTLAQAGRRLALERRALSEAAGRDGAAVRRSAARRVAGTRELADRLAVHDGRSRLPLSRLSGAAGRDAGVVPAQDHRGRRARALPAVSRPRARADRARARSDREARARRLLPDRLGHRQFLPAARHPRAGARLGGQQRRLLQPRHHRRRSGRHGSAVRALPVGGARRVARHRSRSAERRSPRAGHPARLREIRPARRGDDRQRHHLSRPQRGARSGQGARRSSRRRSIGWRR